jgi:hypothetical protein
MGRVSRADQRGGGGRRGMSQRGYNAAVDARSPSKGRRAARLPERPSSACSSSTLRGDLRTSAPGAYLPAVSASGTCAYRRAARAARRPDLMDKPSLQTSQAITGLCRTATPTPLSAASYARCSSFPQGQDDPMTANQPKGFGGSPAFNPAARPASVSS